MELLGRRAVGYLQSGDTAGSINNRPAFLLTFASQPASEPFKAPELFEAPDYLVKSVLAGIPACDNGFSLSSHSTPGLVGCEKTLTGTLVAVAQADALADGLASRRHWVCFRTSLAGELKNFCQLITLV